MSSCLVFSDAPLPSLADFVAKSVSQPSNVLMLRSIPRAAFESKTELAEIRSELEKSGVIVSFQPLKSFGRLRVVYDTIEAAVVAALHFAGALCHGIEIKSSFAERQFIQAPEDIVVPTRLAVPLSTRQFLLSPPASPPVGWEPITEHHPVIDHDLVAAICSMSNKGESYELFKATDGLPGIMVMDCDADATGSDRGGDGGESESFTLPSIIKERTRMPDY
eukprot:Opistho-2@65757